MVLLDLSGIKLLVFTILLCLLGIWTSDETEKVLGKDSSHIVIDEFCGYLISVLFLPHSIGYLIAAFVLFRVFDILKPPPIRQVEKAVPGGLGIMLDDVLAGIFTNICLQIWNL